MMVMIFHVQLFITLENSGGVHNLQAIRKHWCFLETPNLASEERDRGKTTHFHIAEFLPILRFSKTSCLSEGKTMDLDVILDKLQDSIRFFPNFRLSDFSSPLNSKP
jgi:hypothetical protein